MNMNDTRPPPMRPLRACALALNALVAGCGGGVGGGTTTPPADPPLAASPTTQELQCQAAGWQRAVVPAAGLPRLVLWKAPAGWSGAAIVVMHGGGGTHTNFCVANVPLTEPQVRFTALALARGFAVFLLDSHDQVADTSGRVCGKVWDDEVRARESVDLPFIDKVIGELIPSTRAAGARRDTFLVGHSSGGYMAVRAASRFGDRVTAFAPVSSGDPYGWTRDCTRRPGDRVNVAGVGLDNDTGRQIGEPGACAGAPFANERPWDGGSIQPKPAFRVFHHAQDGINDRSCVERVRGQLSAYGYPETAPFTLDGGARSADVHYWMDEYNAAILDFFSARMR